MRVTESMIYDNAKTTLANNLSAIQTIQNQVSSGKQLNQPSDNPADVQTAVGLGDTLAQINQFIRNINTASGTASAMDTALSSAGNILQRANELAIEGANGTLDAGDRQAILAEVQQLSELLATAANTKMGDEYVFGGFRVDTPPYAVTGPGQVGPYQGDDGVSVARIGPASTMQISMPGDAVFGPAMKALADLQADLSGGGAVQQSTLSEISTGLDTIVQSQATVGARENRLSEANTSQQAMSTSNQALLSQLEDTNMPAAITELTSRQLTYQATLAVTAKVMQTSLIDYLK